jgi:intracellular sulfur oxidation DsrE/DsrF family protein
MVKRGVQFMVCATASRGVSRMLAGPNGDAEAAFKELSANLIPNARLVSAGVIGVTRAQEYGYSLIYAG